MSHNITDKRIIRDIIDIQKNPLDNEGIYIHVDEKNIKQIKACIIGQIDTPYQNGFYFFDIQFTNEYPFKPPIVKYQTRYGIIRFNPNLYTCGKVCISILNTWSGPQWTSCQTLRSVLLSLQSIFHENPLHNEPGYENDNSINNRKYNDIITYQNINISIYYIINKIINEGFNGFEVFKDIIIEQFGNQYNIIMKQLEYFKHRDDTIINSIYSMSYLIKYNQLKCNLQKLYNKFYLKENKKKTKNKEIVNKNINQEKKKRKAPNKKAKLYDLGYQTKSENDNQLYIVYKDKNEVKKWKKIKTNN